MIYIKICYQDVVGRESLFSYTEITDYRSNLFIEYLQINLNQNQPGEGTKQFHNVIGLLPDATLNRVGDEKGKIKVKNELVYQYNFKIKFSSHSMMKLNKSFNPCHSKK